MHDAVGDQLGAVVVPMHGAGRRMEGCRGELFQSEDGHANPRRQEQLGYGSSEVILPFNATGLKAGINAPPGEKLRPMARLR
jgi:hypothetical protein